MNKLILRRDTISGMLLLGLSLWVAWKAGTFPQLESGYPGPALFPQIIAISLACAGIFIILRQAKRKTVDPGKSFKISSKLAGSLRLMAGLMLAILYPFLIEYTHFIPVMAMLIMFVGLLLKNAAWHALFMSILSAALIYGLFTQLLKVPL